MNARPARQALPLTAAQRGVWAAHRLAPGSSAYNLAHYSEIRGPVDARLLARAVRHAEGECGTFDVRLAAVDQGAGATQELTAGGTSGWQSVDLRRESDPRTAAQAWMERDRATAPDLVTGVLARAALLRLGDDHYFWYRRCHHILTDTFGALVLARRIAEVYEALLAGEGDPAGDPLGRLTTLLADEAAYRASPEYAADRAYWADRLADRAPVPSLAPGAPAGPAARPITSLVTLSPDELGALHAAGRQARTPWTVPLLAAVGAFLHRVTGRPDITLGVPVTARRGAQMLTIPGMVANRLPLRLAIDPAMTRTDLLRHVTTRLGELMAHQRYPHDDLCRDLRRPDRDEHLFGLLVDITPISADLRFAGRTTTVTTLSGGPVPDLTVNFRPGAESKGLECEFLAHPDRYTQHDVTTHQRRFITFLRALATAEGDSPIGGLGVGVGVGLMAGDVDRVGRVGGVGGGGRVGGVGSIRGVDRAGGAGDVDRAGRQVRMRGFSAEPGEVEDVLASAARVSRTGFALTALDVLRHKTVAAMGAHASAIEGSRSAAERGDPVRPPSGEPARPDARRSTFDAPQDVLPRGPLPAPPRPRAESADRFGEDPGNGDPSAPDNTQQVFGLRGPVDADALHSVCRQLVRRHPVLRTVFGRDEAGRAVRLIANEIDVPFSVQDVRGAAPNERAHRLAVLLAQDKRTRFRPDERPLLRFTLIHLGPDGHLLVLTGHPALRDGHSLPLVLRDLSALHTATRSAAGGTGPDAAGAIGDRADATGGARTGSVGTGSVRTGAVGTGGVRTRVDGTRVDGTGAVGTGGVRTGGVRTGAVRTGSVRTRGDGTGAVGTGPEAAGPEALDTGTVGTGTPGAPDAVDGLPPVVPFRAYLDRSTAVNPATAHTARRRDSVKLAAPAEPDVEYPAGPPSPLDADRSQKLTRVLDPTTDDERLGGRLRPPGRPGSLRRGAADERMRPPTPR
ncbi:condensation domain-containing protein [Streptantibioticus silvisoli]|uniref:Condensation domain-containing protein n=1 Tax=Streptantibioticus silvisoli TaxID=2705255 RepID=A0ABT6VVD3_9ACTN|nr:condensation domain-containing protein [Streptantibioticus silvisoli]MDI5961999.1 condensation domain-containing protein [Streptantibioticus silvisoli]